MPAFSRGNLARFDSSAGPSGGANPCRGTSCGARRPSSANRAREAVAFLENQLARFPADGRLHGTAAKAYAALGNRMQQHMHQAELYAWQGDLKGAVVQLELAVKAGDGDFYQASVVETRLRALRKELLEQQREAGTRNG